MILRTKLLTAGAAAVLATAGITVASTGAALAIPAGEYTVTVPGVGDIVVAVATDGTVTLVSGPSGSAVVPHHDQEANEVEFDLVTGDTATKVEGEVEDGVVRWKTEPREQVDRPDDGPSDGATENDDGPDDGPSDGATDDDDGPDDGPSDGATEDDDGPDDEPSDDTTEEDEDRSGPSLNSGPGSVDDDEREDNSGPGSLDDDDDDSSGPGSGDDEDHSGPGSDDHDDDDDESDD